MDGNLVSVRKLSEKDLNLSSQKKNAYIKRKKNRISIAKWRNGLYQMEEIVSCYKIKEKKNLCIYEWHRILCHRHLADIKRIKSKGLDIKDCKCNEICEECIKGKLVRKSFPKRANDTEEVLDCLVRDVYGSMQIISIAKARYFATSTDIKNGYTEVVDEVTTKSISDTSKN